MLTLILVFLFVLKIIFQGKFQWLFWLHKNWWDWRDPKPGAFFPMDLCRVDNLIQPSTTPRLFHPKSKNQKFRLLNDFLLVRRCLLGVEHSKNMKKTGIKLFGVSYLLNLLNFCIIIIISVRPVMVPVWVRPLDDWDATETRTMTETEAMTYILTHTGTVLSKV